MNKIVITVCGFIYNQDKLFIAKRAISKKFFPGLWELPGGKLENNEEITNCLSREIFEEFNQSIIIEDIFHVFSYIQEDEYVIELIYFSKFKDKNAQVKLDPIDHSEYKWIDSNEVSIYFKDKNDNEYKAIVKGFGLLKKNSIK